MENMTLGENPEREKTLRQKIIDALNQFLIVKLTFENGKEMSEEVIKDIKPLSEFIDISKAEIPDEFSLVFSLYDEFVDDIKSGEIGDYETYKVRIKEIEFVLKKLE